MMKLAPSILSADFGKLYDDVKKVEEAGADFLHIDIMDGHFVPNISIGPLVVESLRNRCNLIFDVHLMIENPDNYIPQFVKAGADIISVHVEACRHLHRTIQNIKSLGVSPGVVLNPATPLETIEYIIEDVDLILLMSVNPGFGGQKFIENTLFKIEKLRKIIDNKNLKIDIEVDGGINLNNVKKVIDAGANVIVAGSAIFESDDVSKTVENFKKLGEQR
ncbi:ribulose-phosphate 3-epimerase [Caloramator quimbayensis]|uniref:Ribulose-phosphate 3-epimerase n=1 Tax=Caloramator quimbayensis TaxID=1147123 RepID=A0A1T4XS21_9CLOT|nr:ribulose-phosphate 3-epimerase [Caloramator quimbayensis]SKA92362.1 ribulose-phosphate 3-epimerase [Caloramator quimbayensis]